MCRVVGGEVRSKRADSGRMPERLAAQAERKGRGRIGMMARWLRVGGWVRCGRRWVLTAGQGGGCGPIVG